MVGQKFVVGDTIMAKWPNTNLYFTGEIIDFNDIQYLVRFHDADGSEFPIKFTEVSLPFTRSRSRSRGRTPTRKSPGRKASKSPARKTTAVKKSPARSPPSEEIVQEKTELKEIKTNSLSLRKQHSATRQSARIAGASEKKTTDEKETIKVDKDRIDKKISAEQTWKGYLMWALSALWATIVPLPYLGIYIAVPFIITQMCTKNKCSVSIPDIPKRLKYYYDPEAVMIVGGFFLYQVLFTFIPLGKVLKLRNGVGHRCNGYIALLGTIAIPLAMIRLKYDLASWYLLYRHMLTSCISLCFIMGIILYVNSFYGKKNIINPAGNSGYLIPDLAEGRQFTPCFGKIDVKLLMFKFWMMFVILLESVILARHWKAVQIVQEPQQHTHESQYSISLLVMTAMHLFYALDFVWFEESLVSTYEYANTGMGLFKMLELITIPFTFAFFPRFLLNHGKELPWYCFVGIAALYLVGYVIVRGANSQKHAFKSNPSDPALAHLESLPTGTGKRILVSGWWGFVRHPNYLGDIIIQLSMVLLCGFNFSLPWIMYGISAFSLIIRIFTVEKECKKEYGLGWSSYTSRVKYRLIPKIF